MFTGIVQATGHIHDYDARGADARMAIQADGLDLSDVAPGDSIAVNGVCLTVIALTQTSFTVDVSAETLRCTEGFLPGAEVNLEKALRAMDRLGGHIVSGHVDGVGVITQFEAVGESHFVEIEAPVYIARYIAAKGSITVNGVSLTVNQVNGNRFTLNLIPHTLAQTTLKHLTSDARVNLEIDMVARYVERLTTYTQTIDKD
ncbi:MAG: riboflavin synthase [Thiobacillaceae bacterium]